MASDGTGCGDGDDSRREPDGDRVDGADDPGRPAGSVDGLGYGIGRPDRDGNPGSGSDADRDVQPVLAALADADCRRLLAELDEPGTAPELAERCDLPRTSAYRKLSALSEADLVDEQIEVREDGHHATRYVRSATGVFVAYDGEGAFTLDVVHDEPDGGHTAGAAPDGRNDGASEGADRDGACETGPGSDDGGGESPDERLARYWSQIGEEL